MRFLVAVAVLTSGCGLPELLPLLHPDAGTTMMTAKTRCDQMPLTVSGMEGQALHATLEANTFNVRLIANGSEQPATLDTGSPVTLLDPSIFSVKSGQDTASLVLDSTFGVGDVNVLGTSTGIANADGPINALIGGNVLCHFNANFDYRAPQVFLGAGMFPGDLSEPVSVAAPIAGGGQGALSINGHVTVVSMPPTRVTVDATIEGKVHPMILDTGASMMVLRSSVFNSLVSDGRKTLSEGASTVMGVESVKITRATSIAIGGQTAENVITGELDDTLLDALTTEVGHNVDGLIGGTFLREFFVSIDYANDALTLRRYPNRSFIHDEFIRCGFALTQSSGQYKVAVVFPGSDAEAKGLKTQTRVISVDGNWIAALKPSAVDALLLGAAGTTKAIQTDTGTLTIGVEDLLAQ